MNKCKSGVYQIKNIVTDQIYIGSSVRLQSRCRDHKILLRKGGHDNPKLQNSWNKYGEESFKFEVLHMVPKEYHIKLEQRYLDTIINWDADFNIARIADRPVVPVKKIIQYDLEGNLVGTFQSARDCAEQLNLNINTIYSCTNGNNKKHKGFIYIYEGDDLNLEYRTTRKKVVDNKAIYQYSLKGEYLRSFSNMNELKRSFNNGKVTAIFSCCTGLLGYAYGYMWSNLKRDKLAPAKLKTRFVIVYQYDLDGSFIRMSNSIKEAAESNGIIASSISSCVKGKRKTAGGFIWRDYKVDKL